MVVNTRMFLRQIHPMYHRTSLGYGGSEESAQLFARALGVTMFHSTNFCSLFLDMIESVGWWIDAPTTSKLAPITVDVSMVSFYAWDALGVYWPLQNEAILLFFVLHFPLHILTKLSLFLYSIECSWDYVMQITVIWVGGYVTALGQRKNRSLLYILHNLLLRRLVKILLCGEILALSELVTNQHPKVQCGIKWIASICNLSAVLRTVTS